MVCEIHSSAVKIVAVPPTLLNNGNSKRTRHKQAVLKHPIYRSLTVLLEIVSAIVATVIPEPNRTVVPLLSPEKLTGFHLVAVMRVYSVVLN